MEPEIVDEEVVEVEDESVDTDTAEAEETSEEIDWEARAKKAEALIIKNKKETKPEEEKSDSNVTKPESERIDRLELRQDGYAPEVIDEIMKLGGKAALDNPILKKSADGLQAEHDAAKAANIDEGSQGQTKTKYSKEDLENMSAEEMEKILPHAE